MNDTFHLQWIDLHEILIFKRVSIFHNSLSETYLTLHNLPFPNFIAHITILTHNGTSGIGMKICILIILFYIFINSTLVTILFNCVTSQLTMWLTLHSITHNLLLEFIFPFWYSSISFISIWKHWKWFKMSINICT